MIDAGFTLAGALTGFVVGMTGVGGGALMTPILLLLFGVAPITAVATDLWFAAITKIVGAGVHHRSGNVDWQVARRLWLGSLPVALTIVVIVACGVKLARMNWLAHAIGVVVLISAIGMLAAPKIAAFSRRKTSTQTEQAGTLQAALTTLSGGIMGVCVALTSVGAGALGSVLLLYLYPVRMQPHQLVATDLVHAIPLAIIVGLGYLFAGMVDGTMLLSLLLGSIPAVLLGSRLSVRMKGGWVRTALALVLLVSGLKILGFF